MRQLLESILTRILDQQKFAEAKNAALATISGAGSVALISAFSIRHASAAPALSAFYLLASASLFATLTVAVWSFFPQLQNKVRPISRDIHSLQEVNLIYFGDIKDLSEEEYLNNIKQTDVSFEPGKIEKDLVNQIIVNSIITSKKLAMFRVAWILLACSVACLLVINSIELIAGSFAHK
jgi:hypothetical protein